MMEARATAKIKIQATSEIIQTLVVYKKGLQFCIHEGWDKKIRNNIKLHPFVYKHLSSIGLQSQLAVACIKQACGMLKRAKSKPVINRVSMRYNFPRSASFKNNILSLATIKGRIKIPFSVPECYKEYFSWNVKESLLAMDKRGRCFFLFTFAKDINSESSCFQNRVLGVDVGINNIAVTSSKMFFGKHIKSLRIKHDKLVSFIEYKALRKGCRIVYVNPAYTSKECSVCHNELVRHSGFVECLHCGFSLSADLNGSRNIALRYMRNMCLATVTSPIVSDYEGKGSFRAIEPEFRGKSPRL